MNETARRDRRRRILDGAARCFVEKGFHAASMAEIAAAAGVSNANVYQYFASKDELILALIVDQMQANAFLIRMLGESDLRPDGLRRVLRPYFETDLGKDMAVLMCEALGEASRKPVIGAIAMAAKDWALQEMAQGIRLAQEQGRVSGDVDAEPTALTLALVFDGVLRQRLLPDASGGQLLETFIDQCCRILRIRD